MDRIRFLIRAFDKKLTLVILASILLLTTSLPLAAGPQATEADKQKTIRRVAKYWIQVGAVQYKRGLYESAEQSLLSAQKYQKYLSADEREKLNKLLEKTHIASLERARILVHLKKADELAGEGNLIAAKANLETVRYSRFLTEEEAELVVEKLSDLNEQIIELKRRNTEIYNRSVELYRTGHLEDARKGFLEVVKSGLPLASSLTTPETYLMKIDNILIQRLSHSSPMEMEAESEKKSSEAAGVGIKDELLGVEIEPAEDEENSHLTAITRKRNILRSYTKAVVSDAIAKAKNCINDGDFDNAEKAIKTAEQIVNKNKTYLGDKLVRQYRAELKQASEETSRIKKEAK